MQATVKKKPGGEDIPIFISTEFIKLDTAVKLSGAVMTGGEAKVRIQEGQAAVNGDICTMRGKKLYPGDRIRFQGKNYVICVHEAE